MVEDMQCQMFTTLNDFVRSTNYIKTVAFEAYYMYFLKAKDVNLSHTVNTSLVTSGNTSCGDDAKCITAAKAASNMTQQYTELAAQAADMLSAGAGGDCDTTANWQAKDNNSAVSSPILALKDDGKVTIVAFSHPAASLFLQVSHAVCAGRSSQG